MKRTLTCFAHGTNGIWEGTCIDFDIAVQGTSFEEVKNLLHESIATYVSSAMKEEPRVRDQLLNRRAPLLVRAQLALGFLWHVLRHKNHGDDHSAGFSMPCPA